MLQQSLNQNITPHLTHVKKVWKYVDGNADDGNVSIIEFLKITQTISKTSIQTSCSLEFMEMETKQTNIFDQLCSTCHVSVQQQTVTISPHFNVELNMPFGQT